MPSAICTPRPCTKSCSENSPSCSSFAISSVTCSPAVTAWRAVTARSPRARLPRLDRLEEVGQADAVVLGLAREDEPLELAVRLLRVVDDQLVPGGVAGEEAEHAPRPDPLGLLGPQPAERRVERLLEQLVPRLALHAAPAPVEL